MLRSLTTIVLVLALTAGVARAAFSAECEGDHYEYDHGECTDRTGDTSSLMRDMYHRSDALENARLHRSFPGLSGPRRTPRLEQPAPQAFSYNGARSPIMPAFFASLLPGTPKYKGQAKRFFEQLLAAYERDAPGTDLPKHDVPFAHTVFLLVAFRALHKVPQSANDAAMLSSALHLNMHLTGGVAWSDGFKQQEFERYAILSELLDKLNDGTGAHASQAAGLARKMLQINLHADPETLSVHELPCLFAGFPGLTCAQYLHLIGSQRPPRS